MNRLRPLLLLLFAGLGLLASAAEARNPLPRREREALIALYYATNGHQWKRQAGWLGPPGTECDWFGVGCADDANPEVTVAYVALLDLASNRLRGTIPRRIGKLGRLYDLILSQNELEGPIPRDLGALQQLRTLYLDSNRLSGTIPPTLGNLRELEVLALSNNALTGGLPPELANLQKVVFFALGGNRLSGPLPPWLGSLSSLGVLALGPNDFSGPIPAEIFRPSRLAELSLSECRLTGRIPPEIGLASNLGRAWFDGNQLVGTLPDSLLGLQELSFIQLSWNSLHTENPRLLEFLRENTDHIAWEITQTLPPVDAQAEATGPTGIRLSWTPVNVYPGLANAAGGYTVYANSSPAGPFTALKTVPGKPTRTVEITGLQPATPYYFRIDTYSLPNPANRNLVRSQRTPIVSATTQCRE